MTDLTSVNAALVAAGGRVLTQEQLTILTGQLAPDELDALVQDAVRGAPTAAAQLRHHGMCLGVLRCLHEVDYPKTTLNDARTLLGAHGEQRLRDILRKAKLGEAGALTRVAGWMLELASPATTVPGRRDNSPRQDRIATVPVSVAAPTPDVVLAKALSLLDDASTPNKHPGLRGVPVALPPRTWDQVKVHGAKAALTVVADHTRAGQPTVTLEAARVLAGQTRSFDWANKLRFQLTISELQLTFALLLGQITELNFNNHGEKWLTLARQAPEGAFAGMIRITVGDDDKSSPPRTVAIDADAYGEVLGLFIRQTAAALRVTEDSTFIIIGHVAHAYTQRMSARTRLKSVPSTPPGATP